MAYIWIALLIILVLIILWQLKSEIEINEVSVELIKAQEEYIKMLKDKLK